MRTLQKNIYSEKSGKRPRMLIPKGWVERNGSSTYMLEADDFMVIIPKGKLTREMKDKIIEALKE